MRWTSVVLPAMGHPAAGLFPRSRQEKIMESGSSIKSLCRGKIVLAG